MYFAFFGFVGGVLVVDASHAVIVVGAFDCAVDVKGAIGGGGVF